MKIIVESFRQHNENSGSSIRVRPLPGQGFSTTMRVECSKKMRSSFPVGQLFCIQVQLKSMLGGPSHLYSNYNKPWNPVTKSDADDFIKKNFTDRNQPT